MSIIELRHLAKSYGKKAVLRDANLNVAPGESLMRTYVIPRARELVGVSLHVGVDEIHGRRRLDQLVEVPR